MSVNAPRVSYDTFTQTAPEVDMALASLAKAVGSLNLDRELLELVELRVSQLNGCASCLQHHLNMARKRGVPNEKLDLLTAWHDAGVFSEREMAALAWAEAVTTLNEHEIPDQTWEILKEHLTEAETISLTIAIGLINMWNRLGAAFRFPPHILRKDNDTAKI